MFQVGDAVRLKDSYSDAPIEGCSREGFVSFIFLKDVTFYSPEWDRENVGHAGYGPREFYVSRDGHWHMSVSDIEHLRPPPDIEEFL